MRTSNPRAAESSARERDSGHAAGEQILAELPVPNGLSPKSDAIARYASRVAWGARDTPQTYEGRSHSTARLPPTKS
jgi:hypothetical protein